MIKTYEALLATALLIGTLAFFSSPYFVPEEKFTPLREIGENAFISFAEENEFRNLSVAVDDNESLEDLRAYIDNLIDIPFTIKVCNTSDTCWGTVPQTDSFAVVSYLFDGNITNHSIKKINLYMWLFKVGN